jgi:hypothetical protein
LPTLRDATDDFSWLLSREYAPTSALKLVGDRYQLTARQRLAVSRVACSDAARRRRRERQRTPDDLPGREVWIDGFNVLTSIEAALSGGAILAARDGCFRDLASMHGSYRTVEETLPAIEVVGRLLADYRLARCRWLFDAPVSNSGRLKTQLRRISEANSWGWEIELVPDPDPILCQCRHVVASADSQVLDACQDWLNLARWAIETRVEAAWVIDLSGRSAEGSDGTGA